MLSRKLIHIVVAVLFLAAGPGISYAQVPVDATITVTNVFDVRQDVAVFELTIARESLRWDLWANGTFRFKLVDLLGDTVTIDNAKYNLRFVPNSSSLPIAGYSNNAMRVYYPSTTLANNMVTVAFIGPDSVDDTHRILTMNQPVMLGRFELSTKDGSAIPKDVVFEPAEPRLHANAFKIDHDSVTSQGSERYVWYSRHDNIEMRTAYQTEKTTRPCDSLVVWDFHGEYVGDLQAQFSFKAKCELGTAGYIIERALIRNRDSANLVFEPRPTTDYTNNTQMVACSVCVGPREYTSIIDDVEYRRTVYAYRLRSVALRSGEITDHDTIFIQVPNAIISNAFIRENPFRASTSVTFNCDDRLMLTASVYDVGGRLITYLLDPSGQPIVNREYAAGEGYTAFFNASDISSQGLYDIVLVGIPINDKTIEDLSRVVIKAQLLR